jgi:hypothetical protein
VGECDGAERAKKRIAFSVLTSGFGRPGWVRYRQINLNDRTYTVVWLALSLDPIDRKHAST